MKAIPSLKRAISDDERVRMQRGADALAQVDDEADDTASADPALAAEAAHLLGLLGTGYLAVVGDGELDEGEYENLRMNWSSWMERDVSDDEFEGILSELDEALETQGVDGALAQFAQGLDDNGRRVAFRVACAMAVTDGQVNDDEVAVLDQIATAYGIPEEEADASFQEIVQIAEQALNAPA